MILIHVSRTHKNARTIFGLFALLSSSVSVADTAVDPGLAADDALANITMAQPDALGAIRTAPAMMPLLPRYQVAVGAGWSSDPLKRISLSAIDSSNGPVALGLNFKRTNGTPTANSQDLPGWHRPNQDFDNESSEIVAGGAAAISFANRQRSIGLGGQYIGRRTTFTDNVDIFELTASGGLHIKEQLLVTFNGRDILQSDGPVHIGSGIRWGPTDTSFNGSPFRSYGGVEFNVDTELDSNGYRLGYWGVSGDLLASEALILRAGYRNAEGQNLLGAGFAVDNVSFGFEYGALLQLGSDGLGNHSHVVGCRIRL